MNQEERTLITLDDAIAVIQTMVRWADAMNLDNMGAWAGVRHFFQRYQEQECQITNKRDSLARDIRALIGDELADSGFCDNIIHDLKSGEAADLTNSSFENQLEYIIRAGVQEQAYGDALEAAGPANVVTCNLCGREGPAKTAHRHQEAWIGEECCWDDRLHSSE